MANTTEPSAWPSGALGWRPNPMIQGSILWHVAGAAMLCAEPAQWPLVLQGLAVNHAVLGAIGMHPRSSLLGANLSRLPEASRVRGEVALTFDDGPDPEVTPRVLDLLDAAGARASFFVIGRKAARHGALIRDILRRGHGVENHTHTHPLYFAAMGIGAQRREILRAQAAIEDAGGRPRCFRAPVGLRSPLLYPALDPTGLLHVAWTRRGADGVRRGPAAVLRCLRGTAAGEILLLHDVGRSPEPSVVLEVLPALLRLLAADGLRSRPVAEVLELPGAAAEATDPSRSGAIRASI